MVSPTLFDHAFGEERRIGNIVGLRRSILDVKVGHDLHLRADDGRISPPISHPISNSFRAVGHFAKVPETDSCTAASGLFDHIVDRAQQW